MMKNNNWLAFLVAALQLGATLGLQTDLLAAALALMIATMDMQR